MHNQMLLYRFWWGVALVRRLLMPLSFGLLLGGCAMVQVKPLSTSDYIAMRRGDILSTGEISASARETVRVAALDDGACVKLSADCLHALTDAKGIDDERRMAALAELWLQQAQNLPVRDAVENLEARIDAWLETARHAYAYLFFTARKPGERAFEDRQTQVRDYYNYAVLQATTLLFERRNGAVDASAASRANLAQSREGAKSSVSPARNDAKGSLTMRLGKWRIRPELTDARLPNGATLPLELIPASSLSFAGLRNVYQRDGFGAELVSVVADKRTAIDQTDKQQADGEVNLDGAAAAKQNKSSRIAPQYSEVPYSSMTLLLHFEGENLAQMLSTHDASLTVHDPYRESHLMVQGSRVPLAGNFTAGYGLWLARSDFARESLRTLLGRGPGLGQPHLYLMQPYDPNRRILLMLHGLASSPEAWVNVANEILGDEALRRNYQVWQMYYPTNMPLAANRTSIYYTVMGALRHFDPEGVAPASRDIVLIGHSMGGVLARLLLSSSGDRIWQWFESTYPVSAERVAKLPVRRRATFYFEPMPGVNRAIFIAAPHRGTDIAAGRLGRWFASLISIPLTLLANVDDMASALARGKDGRPAASSHLHIPNSIENLSATDSFVQVAAELQISPRVIYHSIIAKADPNTPLEDSDDGLVPYLSAHLDGAQSEAVVISGHSVQENGHAILEIRRILHEHLEATRRDELAP